MNRQITRYYLLAAVLAAMAAAPASAAVVNLHFGATDGYVSMPDGSTKFVFGFVDLTNVPESEFYNYKGKCELLGPLIDVYEGDQVHLKLTNLGMIMRPDLDDTHTVHWHGFPNQIPLWDGVPELSISVLVGRDFTYYYEPKDPGTYMYHCHFEPVEHIQMGMVGPLIVRPLLDKTTGKKHAYNDPSTRFDREYILLVTEMDGPKHDMIEMVQEPDWTDFRATYWLLNGRAFPDTIKPGDDPGLPAQPYSSQIKANTTEKVLLRIIHLGYEQHSLELLGITFKVVGEDAMLRRGLNGEDLNLSTSTLFVGAGKTQEAIFNAPAPGEYPLFNRNYSKQTGNVNFVGGMLTSVKVYKKGTLPPQSGPNK